jgi:transcriptional regulator of acetoin/glycerol metabolism
MADIVESDSSLFQNFSQQALSQGFSSSSSFANTSSSAANGAALQPTHSVPFIASTIKADEDELKKQRIIATLTETNGNVSKSASQMGISRETLHTWMKRYGIESREFKRRG